MHHIKSIIKHFFKYLIPGVLTFGVDLGLLWVLMEYFEFHYLPAAVIAFAIGTTVNYIAVHKWVFFGSKREFHTGYVYFMTLAGIGIALTAFTMLLFIEIFGLETYIARILTAGVVGIWNFGMNYFINFKMHHVVSK